MFHDTQNMAKMIQNKLIIEIKKNIGRTSWIEQRKERSGIFSACCFDSE